VYHQEDGEGVHVDDDTNSLRLTETERRKAAEDSDKTSTSSDDNAESENEEPETPVHEIRDGIPDERDVEARPHLEKAKSSKSARSVRDPNLVSLYPVAVTARD
jgi:hypothetical protein